MEYGHEPVLLQPCIDGLRIRPDGVYVDGTLGRAGHARAIARQLTTGRLICIDRDQAALDAAPERLGAHLAQAELVHGDFRFLHRLLNERGVGQADGILLDLGVSSPQLDDGSRGFSYQWDGPLDMRMDTSSGLTAAEVVNQWPCEELRRILFQYGEERYAPAIAAAICRARAAAPLTSTCQLAEVIRSAMPGAALREKQHPAKRSFQAIRIAVNDELAAISEGVAAAVERLGPGGRLAVISFHSLEDRIVKTALAGYAKGCVCPPDFPVCVCGRMPQIRLLSRRPITAQPEEIQRNPRARSAKLRICEKLGDKPKGP